jgi:hypothetical protein
LNFRKVIDTVGGFLDKRGFRYALAGAFAMHAYGISRATADIDLVVDGRGRSELIAFLESLGYETLHASVGYSNHLHAIPALGRIDCIYIDGETADQLFEHARQTGAFQGVRVWVPRPEHLCAMKVLAMRNDPSRSLQEMADIQRLLEIPEIDQNEVRGYFERYDLLEAFHEIKKRSART